MADVIAILEQMRASSGHAETTGLTNDVILDFASRDNTLVQAIEEAGIRQGEFSNELLMMAENDLVSHLQEDFVNFYAPATINPYVAVAARGPWIVTSHGAVVHDNGGYGMLGGGHGPEEIIDAMSKNHVMANVMTPSISQARLAAALKKELGHTRGSCPFSKFICISRFRWRNKYCSRILDL